MVVSYNLEPAAPIINKAEYSRVLQGIFIPRNKSCKLKTVADNTIFPNITVSSENIDKSIKLKQRTAFISK